MLIRLVALTLPQTASYGDHLTRSGRSLLWRLLVFSACLILMTASVALAFDTDWKGVLSGAIIGVCITAIPWAFVSYRSDREATDDRLQRLAELDLLHQRLNSVAAALGFARLDLNGELDEVIAARVERIAHFAGLDDHRPEVGPRGYNFWAKAREEDGSQF